jgi:predicted DNA-binding transcriptional regulator AlpA
MEGFKKFITDQPEAQKFSDGDIIHLYHQNLKIEEISAQTGYSTGEIYRTLKRNHISPNRLKTNHHNVMYYYNAGMDLPRIADLTGYTERNIRYILKNRLQD